MFGGQRCSTTHIWVVRRQTVKQLKCLCKTFTKFAAKFHTHKLFLKLFHCHFVANLTNSLCTRSVQRM